MSAAVAANLPALPSALSPEGNLSRYLSEIRKFPLLEPQEEFMLAKRWREHGDSQELGQRKHMLAQALKQLSDRERHIIVERRLADEPQTLEDLSAKYGISRERVRQIEVRAFDKLQKAMKNMVVEAANESSRRAEAHAARPA